MKINNCLCCGSCFVDIAKTGGFAVDKKEDELWYVYCIDCSASGIKTRSKRDAIKRWNILNCRNNITNIVVDNFEVEIDKKAQYGRFKHKYGYEKLSGSLWFENNELIGYSGYCNTIPDEVVEGILKLGFKINAEDKELKQ